MAYYRICPDCGCNLDPGEKCDCQEEKQKQRNFYAQHIKVGSKSGQMAFCWDIKEERHAETPVC